MSKDNDEVAVKVSGVSKSFKLPHEKNSSIKSFVTSPFRRRSFEKQEVLKDINFEIKKGEFFGIVGRNGSGKSTLLKLLAGIYSPDKGHIQINGKLTPFIELGVGFNPELTGRENVFLNGALLGFNRKEMSAMYEEIVAFAELGKFMDQKLKNYSSGMQVRLAFSIAIRAESDILVLDEVLAVGDEAFQRKCYEYFAQLKISKKTVILVTHGMDNVTRFCDRAMLVNKGNIEYIGDAGKAAALYEKKNLEYIPSSINNRYAKSGSVNNNANIKTSVEVVNEQGEPASRLIDENSVHIQVNVVSEKLLKDVFLGLSIHKPNGEAVFLKTTEEQSEKLSSIKPNIPIKILFDIQNIFSEEIYFINISIKSNDRSKVYLTKEDVSRFQVIVKGIHKSTLRPNCRVEIVAKEKNK